MISAQKRLHSVFKQFFGDHSVVFGKSKNLDRDMVNVLKEKATDSNLILFNLASICEFGTEFSEKEKKELLDKAIEELDAEWLMREP